jgi:uncharacterized OB-fold protein
MSAYVSLPLYLLTVPQRHALVAKRCIECRTLNFPARPVCSSCGRPRLQDEKLSGLGTIHTFTVSSKGGGPAEFDDQQDMTGAAVAIVELEEGPRVIGQFSDITAEASRIAIGMKVKPWFDVFIIRKGLFATASNSNLCRARLENSEGRSEHGATVKGDPSIGLFDTAARTLLHHDAACHGCGGH